MLGKVFSKEFFSERALLLLAGMAIISMTVTVFRVLATVRSYDFKVATGFTQYGADSFRLGEWYSLYEFAIFAVLSTAAAILISARLLKVDRSLSYLVLILQQIVLVFLFIVSSALLSASGVAA